MYQTNLSHYLKEFSDYLLVQRGFSVNTINGYNFDLGKFNLYLTQNDYSTNIDQIQDRHVYSYLAYLSNPNDGKKSNTLVSRTRKLYSIRSFFRYLRRRQFITSNPTEFIELPRLPQKEPDYLTPNEYHRLIETVKKTASPYFYRRDLAIIIVLISTGIRVSELIGLKVVNLDFEQQTIKVRRKGNKEQTIPLNTSSLEALRAYLDTRPLSDNLCVFLSKNKQAVRANSVYCLTKKYLKRARIIKSKQGPHLLRHTCFTTLIQKNVNPVVIQQLAGHNSFDTTRRYLHLNNNQIKEAVNKIQI